MPRLFLRLLALMSIASGLLLILYPWNAYYDASKDGWGTIAISYALLGALMSFTGGFLSPWLAERTKQVGGSRVAVITFLVLLFVAGIFSRWGFALYIPGTRIRAIFFADSCFLVFLLQAALPFSVVAGVFEHGRLRGLGYKTDSSS